MVKLKKITIFIFATSYFIIGFSMWWGGRVLGGGPFPENIFTFLYIVFLWPFVLGRFLLFS